MVWRVWAGTAAVVSRVCPATMSCARMGDCRSRPTYRCPCSCHERIASHWRNGCLRRAPAHGCAASGERAWCWPTSAGGHHSGQLGNGAKGDMSASVRRRCSKQSTSRLRRSTPWSQGKSEDRRARSRMTAIRIVGVTWSGNQWLHPLRFWRGRTLHDLIRPLVIV